MIFNGNTTRKSCITGVSLWRPIYSLSWLLLAPECQTVPVWQVTSLYSRPFSRYSASFHWLVHGHMTSNNETVSRQMPWAGNIAKAMTSNGKQFTVTRSTVHCWPLLHVMVGISARFSNFAFVLFCYITNHLMTGPLGNSEFCFPRISMFPERSRGKHWDSRETKFIVPQGTSY